MYQTVKKNSDTKAGILIFGNWNNELWCSGCFYLKKPVLNAAKNQTFLQTKFK